MKKFESLGRDLSKKELNKITGGYIYNVDDPNVRLTGWRLTDGQCYCDFLLGTDPGIQVCDQECAMSYCQ